MTNEEKDEDHLHYHGVDKAEQHVGVSEALEAFLLEIKKAGPEVVSLPESDNRILFSEVKSPADLPKLARSTRDGYAIKVSLTGDDDFEKQAFKITGEVRIGKISNLTIDSNEAAKIATGSYIPKGANAVVMKEYSRSDQGTLRITKRVKAGENILSPGEDLKKGTLLFEAGTRVRPQQIALLSLLGVRQLKVYSKPRIAVLSTGDELQDLVKRKNTGKSTIAQTFDSNRPFLLSAISELGGIPVDLGIVHDNFEQIRARIVEGLKYEALFLSAGSSVGERDFVSMASESIKGMQMIVHGVAMRPSSPTGLAVFRGKPVVFLPGFPTSAIVSFYVFGRPAILKSAGKSATGMPTLKATITDDYSGKAGLTHFVRVHVENNDGQYKASVLRPTEAQYSSWLREANGIAIIGQDGNANVKSGDQVPIFLIGDID